MAFSNARLAGTVLIMLIVEFQPCLAQFVELAPVLKIELADERPTMYGVGIGINYLDTSSGIWLGLSGSYMKGKRIWLSENLNADDVDIQLGIVFGGTKSISGKWKLKGGIRANFRSLNRSSSRGFLHARSSYDAQAIACGLTAQFRYKLNADASMFFGTEPGYLFILDQNSYEEPPTEFPLRSGIYIGFQFGFVISLDKHDMSNSPRP